MTTSDQRRAVPGVMLPMAVPTLEEVCFAIQALHLKYGGQVHEDGTGYAYLAEHAAIAARECESRFAAGIGSWRLILRKAYRQAIAHTDPTDLRDELIQVAAAAIAWAEAINERTPQ